jgi:hypothetical protein
MGKPKNRCAGVLLLLVLFGLGLAWMCISTKAQAEVKEEWVRTSNSGQCNSHRANAVHVDKRGNVFVTGSATVKYSPGGRELWNRLVPSVASCLDSRGNLYTAGEYSNTGEFMSSTYVISKYDNDGNPI